MLLATQSMNYLNVITLLLLYRLQRWVIRAIIGAPKDMMVAEPHGLSKVKVCGTTGIVKLDFVG